MGKRKLGFGGLPNPAAKAKKSSKLRGWSWWRSIGSPKYVCAPMVDQSERAFRALCFRHNVSLAYTPMWLADIIKRDPDYRKSYVQDDLPSAAAADSDDDDDDGSSDGDGSSSSARPSPAFVERPLIAQLGGSSVSSMVYAARWLESSGLPIDAIDVNLGCPQSCARRGSYGAFSSLDDAARLVQSLDDALVRLPVTVKIRVLSAKGVKEDETTSADISRTVAYARRLASAGASVVAVHGRTRTQKGRGKADWPCIKAVVDALRVAGGRDGQGVPVVANGNVRTKADADRLLLETGAAAAMSAEALLSDPLLFSDPEEDGSSNPSSSSRSCFAVAEEYLSLACSPSLDPPPPIAWSRAHVVALLRLPMSSHPSVASLVDIAPDLPSLMAAVKALDVATAKQPSLRALVPPMRRAYGSSSAGSVGQAVVGGGSLSRSAASAEASDPSMPGGAEPSAAAAAATAARALQMQGRSAQGRHERHVLKVSRAKASRAKREALSPPGGEKKGRKDDKGRKGGKGRGAVT